MKAMNFLLEPELQDLSRRSFLKLTGASLLSLFLLPWNNVTNKASKLASNAGEVSSLGRVVNNRATLRKSPTLNADILQRYHMDMIIPITGITLSDDPQDYNRIWYEINNGEGYTYSGGIQPVEVNYNPVVKGIPENGALAEVTVPYTDAVWTIKRSSGTAYRYYSGTTHWIYAVEQDEKGSWWYRVRDDKLGYFYYVNATHLHLVLPTEISPLSTEVPLEEKRIEIRLAEQVVMAYEGDKPVFMSRAATGAKFRDGDYRTKPGTYLTNRKRPSRHMAAGEPGVGSGFDLPGVPWVCYLTVSGVSLHGTYWHNDFGSPRSHGCINLPTSAARWFYRWTNPSLNFGEFLADQEEGTKVVII
jgi:lipoprotein-anchoring transpeptidase ErfK/SrfK